MTRSVNSIRNAIVAIISNIITIIIGLIAQKVFINTLGSEYLGINGLFSNILSMLAIVELGIGSAIIYSLYKPIAQNDKEKIKSLMNLYKISYRIIACIIAIIGIILIPFLSNIIGQVTVEENITFLYLLALIEIVASYLLSYKRSILYASQKTYLINIIHIGYLIILNALQVIILLTTRNYVLYLILKIICRILENIIITIIANKLYPYLKEKNIKSVDQEIKDGIIKRVKGLIFHKFGTFIILGTDNIIISRYLGVIMVGLYSNYYMIIQAVSNFFMQIFDAITASVGNLLVEENEEKSYSVYKKMLMINSVLFTYASAAILCLMEPFIKLWVGEEFILPYDVLVVLVINFYIQGMRRTPLMFKTAAGIFYQDRFVPLIESLVNIVSSIIFLKIFGLAGVFMGTITSSLIVSFWSYPIYMYKPLFKKKYSQYIKENIYYYVIASVSVIIVMIITKSININIPILTIVINILIITVGITVLQIIFFHKKEEYNFIKEIIGRYVLKLLGKTTHSS